MSGGADSAEVPSGVKPVVAGRPGNWPVWLFTGVMAAIAIGLFFGLEARRNAISSPSTAAASYPGTATISSPPELAIPSGYAADEMVQFSGFAPSARRVFLPPAMAVPFQPPRAPRIVRPNPYNPGVSGEPVVGPSGRIVGGYQPPAVVYQAPAAPVASPQAASENGSLIPTLKTGRAEAGRLANPSTTVPQGAVIHAVMETALSSDRPGFVRAIVSQDVRGFDGTRILIPRGSRLYGEYRADLAPGQKRAFIQWQRLMRPDGVIIAIESPAADPLGRAGVGGHVNTHFFQRLGGAVLQTVLDIGSGLATRSINDRNVILAMPGSTQITDSSSQTIKPTLTVRQGTSVSVFVARDLDFITVEQ